MLHVDDSARKWLALKGYDEKMGARPMSRVIQEYIKKPLAEEVLFGHLTNGGDVHVFARNGEIELEFEKELVES
jgi:ATP-dependent Clp protease ATP-binding subunit ClpA